MSYIGSSISVSPTIAGTAAAAIENGAGKAVKYDTNGKIVLCSTAGESALGFLILQTDDKVEAGDTLTIQIFGIGMAVAGGTVAAGDLLAVNASAQVVKAADGNHIIGQALPVSTGGFISIQMLKGGQLNAAAS